MKMLNSLAGGRSLACAVLLAAAGMPAAAQEEVVPLAQVPESPDPIILPLYE